MMLWPHNHCFDQKKKATISFGCIVSAGIMPSFHGKFGDVVRGFCKQENIRTV